uniref:Uncharacterized protein n=1 Tax=Arundo donax TaxID=35708 RepID=A0A0A9C119_ARUDO
MGACYDGGQRYDQEWHAGITNRLTTLLQANRATGIKNLMKVCVA